MKTKTTQCMLAIFFSIFLLCFSCASNDDNESRKETTALTPANDRNELEGAWELIWSKTSGVEDKNQMPKQMKLFIDGFFCLIMQDSAGKWNIASAGTYETNGKEYKETHRYVTLPEWVGMTDWQEFEIKGDTLYKKLFTKIINSKGEDVTAQYPKIEEKRVRAKK